MSGKRIIFINGRPNSGKTSLSFLLRDAFPEKVNLISLDALIRQWLIEKKMCSADDDPEGFININTYVKTNEASPYLGGAMIIDLKDRIKEEIKASSLEVHIVEGITIMTKPVNKRSPLIVKLEDELKKELPLPTIKIRVSECSSTDGQRGSELRVNGKEKVRYKIPNERNTPNTSDADIALCRSAIIPKILEGSEVLNSFMTK